MHELREALFVLSEMEDLALSEGDSAALVALASLGSDGKLSYSDFLSALSARRSLPRVFEAIPTPTLTPHSLGLET